MTEMYEFVHLRHGVVSVVSADSEAVKMYREHGEDTFTVEIATPGEKSKLYTGCRLRPAEICEACGYEAGTDVNLCEECEEGW